jgi:tRNA modification GTPase
MKSLESDTIAALATAPGKSGVCVVRISGPLAKDIATSLLGYEPKPRYAHYGNFTACRWPTAGSRESACSLQGPASFTGEDVFEIQGHGGTSVQNLLLSRALELGARLARPGEFSERAFLNDKIDLVQAEAIADLIDASSTQAAQSALRTLSGEFSNLVRQLVSDLTKTRVNIEAAIDFSDEDIDVISDTRVHDSLEQLSLQLATTLQQANQGSLLKEGMQVVIAGKP